MTKFDLMIYYILTDLIFLFLLLFCIMVLFQDNHKLVEARFVWWVVGWRLGGFPLRVASGVLPTMFFKICSHFQDFWSRIGVVILVTPKHEVERKSEWFYIMKFFLSDFNLEWENGVWTRIRFLASGFLFKCGNVTLIFTVFLFFLNGFPNPFIVHCRSIFYLNQISISR